jgi:hypothetical protein
LIACQLWAASVSAAELVDAARNDDLERVARLIESGADVNERGRQRATALHWVAFHGDDAMVGKLIASGASVDATLANGSTPLHIAAYKGHTAVVSVLLGSGADVDAMNRGGITPVDWARRNRHPAIVALLGGDDDQTARTVNTDLSVPLRPESAPPTAEPRPSSAGPGRYRVQLVAVGSEARAEKAVAGYRGRFADVLRDESLTIEAVGGPDKRLYRVQSGPLSSARAWAICEELRRRDQACLVRVANSD